MVVAGAPGFEPGDGGTKNRCLTAWLRPNGRRDGVPVYNRGQAPKQPSRHGSRSANPRGVDALSYEKRLRIGCGAAIRKPGRGV